MSIFRYQSSEYVKNLIKNKICKCKNRDLQIKDKVFKVGIRQIKEKLEIVSLLKSLQTVKFIQAITLSKYQQNLVHLFKNNVLNLEHEHILEENKLLSSVIKSKGLCKFYFS